MKRNRFSKVWIRVLRETEAGGRKRELQPPWRLSCRQFLSFALDRGKVKFALGVFKAAWAPDRKSLSIVASTYHEASTDWLPEDPT